MFGNSEYILTNFLLVEFVAAIPAIWLGYIELSNVTTKFVGFHFLGITLVLIGVALAILGLISCAMLESHQDILMVKNICCSMPLVVVLLALGIFMVAVSTPGGGKAVPGRSYEEYEVESYSMWMQNKVNANWDNYYRKAVVKNKEFVCKRYDSDPTTFEIRANPVFQAPRGCKLCSLNNQTSSQRSIKLELESGDHCSEDCHRWDNDPNTLCFDCESCKAGFLQDITKVWLGPGIGLVCIGVILLGLLLVVSFS
ncbi:Tetraspanin-9 [Bienertia sinuspersici]